MFWAASSAAVPLELLLTHVLHSITLLPLLNCGFGTPGELLIANSKDGGDSRTGTRKYIGLFSFFIWILSPIEDQ